MKMSGLGHELTNKVDCMGDIELSNSQVDQTPNKLPVYYWIRKRSVIIFPVFHIELYGCIHLSCVL